MYDLQRSCETQGFSKFMRLQASWEVIHSYDEMHGHSTTPPSLVTTYPVF
jgi:hypothetical protein